MKKICIAENENEALRNGDQMKIYDGHRWVIGILWKTIDMIGSCDTNLLVLEDGEE